MAEIEVVLVAVRDIFQDEAGRKSLFSEEYRSLSALITLDKQDMASLAVKDGDKLLVKSDAGSIVVAARASKDEVKEAHPGLAFICVSPCTASLSRMTDANASASRRRSPPLQRPRQ